MNALVAPEVWEALLPVRKASPASHNQARNDLKILAAACGIHDVTSTLQALVIDEEMAIRIDAIKGLVNEDIYKKELPLLGWNLSFIYQYGAGSMRICSANYRKKSSESVHISKTSDHPIVTSRESIGRKFPLVAIVYGGSIYNSKDQLRTVEKHISQGCKNDFTHEECIVFDDTLFGANWNGVEKTGVVFFTNQIDSCVHATNENSGCTFDSGDLKFRTHHRPFLTFDNGINFVCQRADLWLTCMVYEGPTRADNVAVVSESCFDGSLSLKNHDGTAERLPGGGNGPVRLVFSSTKPYIEIYDSEGKRIWDSESTLDQ
ncbi:hypothetical protein ACHAPD_001023 [Fusarium lateritium]